MKTHKWTPIASEACENFDEPGCVWFWCIRCGILKLGDEIFKPGPKQKMTIVSCKQKYQNECLEGKHHGR
jgi:hypothetical protein